MKPVKAWAIVGGRPISELQAWTAKGVFVMPLPVVKEHWHAKHLVDDLKDRIPDARIIRVEIRELPARKKGAKR